MPPGDVYISWIDESAGWQTSERVTDWIEPRCARRKERDGLAAVETGKFAKGMTRIVANRNGSKDETRRWCKKLSSHERFLSGSFRNDGSNCRCQPRFYPDVVGCVHPVGGRSHGSKHQRRVDNDWKHQKYHRRSSSAGRSRFEFCTSTGVPISLQRALRWAQAD